MQESIEFQRVNNRVVEAAFDGGMVTSDAGGALLLRQFCDRQEIFERLTECFSDKRTSPVFSITELLKQRIYGLALGYEDLNDHDTIRRDPGMAVLLGKTPGQDSGAGKSTLNRLEHSATSVKQGERYKKIALDDSKLQHFFLNEFLRMARRKRLKRLILDFDATDITLHGNQEGKFFHGYYRNYCYLPLYCFCEDMPLWVELRTSDIDASKGTEEALAVIVPFLRKHLPRIRIVVRGDSGFAREGIMAWCETNGIDYIFGLAKNDRLIAHIQDDLTAMQQCFEKTQQSCRTFSEFRYRTLDSWSRTRKVVGKAEHLQKGSNPRFIVTSLKTHKAITLYEQWYCKRGDMENNIKEQLQLFSDRLSGSAKRTNQIRLWLSAVAYLIIIIFRLRALRRTTLANAEPATIRLRLFKLGASVKLSVRRIYFSLAESFPLKDLFLKAALNL